MREHTTYVPGVCNIGKAEIKRRWIAAWVGLIISGAALVLFSLVSTPWYLKLLVFIPASVGTTSFQQAMFGFCVKFGFEGVFNFGPDVGKTDSVEQAEFRRRDRAKAVRIAAVGVLAASTITFCALLIPNPVT